MSNIKTGSVFLERFHIIRRLGRGSYGRVYEAVDLFNGDRLAIKMSSKDEYNKERNIIESQILETLNNFDSPYKGLVVEMKMCIILEDCVAVVLELLSHSFSKSLEMNMIQGRAMISKYAKQLVECLHFMSQADVIHGDIKPENILHELEGDGIKLADFGLAHSSIVKEKAKHIQTLYYTAPEVILGYDYDLAVDTWSVGCVLFECLTKKRLFRVEDKMELLQRMGQIIGAFDRETINHAPNRGRYFEYDPNTKSWVMIGLSDPISPAGLRNHLQWHYGIDVDDPECQALIDLIEGMLRLNPLERYTPEECLAHPYFQSGGEKVQKNSIRNKLAGLKRVCFKMNLPGDLVREASDLYKAIASEKEELAEGNKTVVLMSCIYVECFKRKLVRSVRDFVSASGINGVMAMYLAKTVRKITNMSRATEAYTKIYRHCRLLGLTWSAASRVAKMVKRIVPGEETVRIKYKTHVIAAAIYIAARLGGCKVSFEAIERVTGIQKRPVKRCVKLMAGHIKSLLSL